AQASDAVRRLPVYRLTLKADFSGKGRQQTEQAVDDGCAAHAVAADQTDDLTLFDIQVDVEERLAGAVFCSQTLNRQHNDSSSVGVIAQIGAFDIGMVADFLDRASGHDLAV